MHDYARERTISETLWLAEWLTITYSAQTSALNTDGGWQFAFMKVYDFMTCIVLKRSAAYKVKRFPLTLSLDAIVCCFNMHDFPGR